MRRRLAAAILATGFAAGAAAAEEKGVDRWKFFDHGEEKGWTNTNRHGVRIAVHACEAIANTGGYRFFFTGVFENYSADRDKEYWLSAGPKGGKLREVYVYTSKGYFDYVYNFAIGADRAASESGFQFCARSVGGQSEKCQSFTGRDFRKVIASLCSSPEIPEEPEATGAPVEAFYLALEEGDGRAAAANVIPEKRVAGPLSAAALSNFYGNLKRPLRLLGVLPAGEGKYRARYTFETWNGVVCDGASVSTVTHVDGVELIAGIRAENGC